MEQPRLIRSSLGERLREARVAGKRSVADAARFLKCDPSRVRAIEADERGGLAPVYFRGFVKSYAAWLGVPPGEIEGLLEAGEDETPLLQPAFESSAPVPVADRWLRAASYLLASLLVGTLAWQLTHEAVRLTRIGVEEPRSVAAPANEPAHVSASIAGLESLPTPPGGAGAEAWSALEAAREQPCGAPLNGGEHCLEVLASADSWVEITGFGGERIEQDLLRGGDQRSYRGRPPFLISIGRSSAVRLRMDGRPVDLAPHTVDDVTRMRLEPAPNPAQLAEDPPGSP